MTECKHKYLRNGVCRSCDAKNPRLWGNDYSVGRKKMLKFRIEFTLLSVRGSFETTIRAVSLPQAEHRIRYALKDLFGAENYTIVKFEQIKGEKENDNT